MHRDQLLNRIGVVCGEATRETDRVKLLGLFRELDALIRQYRGENASDRAPPSEYEADADLYSPTEEDIAWARRLTNMARHLGVAVFPDAKLVYEVDHHQRTLTLLNP